MTFSMVVSVSVPAVELPSPFAVPAATVVLETVTDAEERLTTTGP